MAKKKRAVKPPVEPASNEAEAPASNKVKVNETVARRHERFAREYVIDHNGTRAYMRVYDVDENVARASAPRLLVKVSVRRLIDQLEREVADRLSITKEKIEREIASMAFVDIRDFYNDDATLKAPREWTREMAAAVQQVEVFEEFAGRGDDRELVGYTKKLKLWPRLEANAMLGAPHGVGVKRLEVGDPGSFDRQRTAQELRKEVAERGARLGLKLVSAKRE